jgi:uncharacterized protein involved in exopolysaccharide biosynthesis
VVVAFAIILGLLGFWWSDRQPDRFTAATRVFLASSAPFDGVGQASFVNDPDRYAINQAAVATSTPVLDRARAALGLHVTPEEFRESLAVTAGRGTDVLVIEATAASAVRAAAASDAVALAYEQYQATSVREQTQSLLRLSTSREDRAAILQRAAVYGSGVALLEPAAVPTTPSAPQPVRDAILAALLGGVLGTGLALALDTVSGRRAARVPRLRLRSRPQPADA